ncbi:MAG: late competence development ComFB family protein [Angelakisella sp.]
MIKNYVEILVEEYLAETLAKNTEQNLALRHSPDLLSAIQVQALNNIPPFYVTCKEGEVYGFSKNSLPQNKADIMIEIAKAIEVVSLRMYN